MNHTERSTPRGHDKSIDELQDEAADTRRRVSQDVAALSNKLSPESMKAQAKSAVEGATDRTIQGAKAKANHAVQSVKHAAGGAKGGVVNAIRENPIPTAMVGLGLGWLAYSAMSQRDGRSMAKKPDLNQERLSTTRRKAVDHTRARVRAATGRMHEIYQENPLLVGAVTMGAGLALGMMLPGTHTEDEWVGPYRDTLLDKAQEETRGVLDRGKRAVVGAADAAASTAKAEFSETGR